MADQKATAREWLHELIYTLVIFLLGAQTALSLMEIALRHGWMTL
jgi:hypothetical protein